MEEGLTLAGEDLQLARYLFRDCREVRLRSLQGGYSGNRVLAARSTDQAVRRQPSSVTANPKSAEARLPVSGRFLRGKAGRRRK